MNKLIYILNSYSKSTTTHFHHIIRLLEEIASNNTEIVLIIEKCTDTPLVNNKNIKIIPINKKKQLFRYLITLKKLITLNRKGFKVVFIRITLITAVFCIIISWFTGQKNYFWMSGTTLEDLNNLSFNLKNIKKLFKTKFPFLFVKKFTYRFVTGPEYMLEYYHKIGKVKKEKLRLLYNDIDINRFSGVKNSDQSLLEKLNIPKDHIIILFVHRFSPVRKTTYYFPFIFDYFFDRNNSPVIFLLVGDGPEKNILEKQINEKHYSKKVRFLGSIPNSDIHSIYKLADIFINPTYTEGFPRVLLEAMATGLPIVTTDAGGTKDILGPKQLGYMIPKNDRTLFSEKLLELVNNESISATLKSENLESVKRYSTERVARMYIDELF